MKEKYSILGMTCTACSSGIERTVSKIPGVERVEVSLMGESMTVVYDECIVEQRQIIGAVEGLGYAIQPYVEKALIVKEDKTDGLKKRFYRSLILLLPLMYCSMGGMISLPVPPFGFNYCIQAVLSLLIVFLNFKFFTSGVKALINRVPNMDTLVSLGAAVSWMYSAILTVVYFANGDVAHMYFESAAMILTLVTLGKWLEEKSKRKTGDEIEKLISLMPKTVSVVRGDLEKNIAFSDIAVNDVLIVRQGDYIPVDGKIIEGHGFIDRAAITGESLPVEVFEGDCVTGADILKSGYVKVLAEKVGADTTLSQIVKMVKEAGASKAPLQKIADKISGIFVPAVCFIALLTLIIWLGATGDFSLAANHAISVLVISCPCSLGLATPVAVMAAMGKGMSLGILYKDAEVLQKAREINCVLLDKTATLTVGRPKVTDFEVFAGSREECLRIAFSIEEKSNHPLAECIKEFVASEKLAGVSIEGFRYEEGKGAIANYAGVTYYLGNRKLVSFADEKRALQLENRYSKEGKTAVFLANNAQILAVFAIADTLKETSREAVSLLHERGIRVGMLTGDVGNVAAAIAEKVGIEEYFAEALPQNKAQAVERVRSVGGVVAMVGDGINDSPALKTADVGVAMGTGTDIAIDSADVVLVGGDLTALSTMIDLSQSTVKNIKQNLFWAFFYNVVAIPVAAGVFAWANLHLNPMIAAACMSLSSLFVVSNALRLTRFQPKNTMTATDPMLGLESEDVKATNDLKRIMTIQGMICKHCVAHVTKALASVSGVSEVEVSLDEGCAYVTLSDVVSDDCLISAVVEAGYEVSGIKTTK